MAKAKEKPKSTIETKVKEVKVDAVAPPTPPINVPIPNEFSPKKKAGRPSTGDSKYTEEDREKFRGPNYYKYPDKREQIFDLADGTRTAKELSTALGLSQPTMFKYLSLAIKDCGKELKTLEEKIHLERGFSTTRHVDKNNVKTPKIDCDKSKEKAQRNIGAKVTEVKPSTVAVPADSLDR